jgi:hypothetical protein
MVGNLHTLIHQRNILSSYLCESSEKLLRALLIAQISREDYPDFLGFQHISNPSSRSIIGVIKDF